MRSPLWLLVPVLAGALLLTGCAQPATGPGAGDPVLATPAPTDQTAIYTAVLRRFLTGNENSFGDHKFPAVYLLNRTDSRAADPMRSTMGPDGPQLAEQDQLAASLADLYPITFVPTMETVVVTPTGGCAQVRDGGMLILLAPPRGTANRVEVGIHGFVACEGSTWLTYVVVRSGTGWRVTGTTGEMAVS